MEEKYINILERIAVSLEKIADSLAKNNILNKLSSNNIGVADNNSYNNEENKFNIVDNNPSFLIDFLKNIDILVDSYSEHKDSDEIINKIALFLGNNYSILHDILANIKRNMNKGGTFNLNLKNIPQLNIGIICQFSYNLHSIAFLEQYFYKKSPHYNLFIKTSTYPMAQNFFSGQWLERFTLMVIKEVVRIFSYYLNLTETSDINLKFSYLLNPKITLTNGDKFELDCLFQINDNIYWVECKTGDYQQHVSKYSKFLKTLNLDDKRCFLLLSDIPFDKTILLSKMYSMCIIPFTEFRNKLIQQIYSDLHIQDISLDVILEHKNDDSKSY